MTHPTILSTALSPASATATDMHAEFARAQRQADELAGPALPWTGAAERRLRRRNAIGCAALLACAAGLAAAAYFDLLNGRPSRNASRAVPTSHMPAVTIAPADAPARPRPAAVNGAASAARGHAEWRRDGRELVVDVQGVAIDEVARLLGAATRSTIHVAAPLLPRKIVTWSWRGREGSEAWRSLLGANVNYASRCDGLRCELWLAGEVPRAEPPASASQAARPSTPVAAVATAAPAEGDLEQLAFGDPQ